MAAVHPYCLKTAGKDKYDHVNCENGAHIVKASMAKGKN